MCGIVGIASGTLSMKEVGMFDDLMIVSNLRGRQGSGIITIGKEAGGKELQLHSVKVLGSGIQAISSSEYRKRAYAGTPSVLVGHTRWPTKGGTDIDAVHPHAFKKVVGVHNGTLQRVAQNYVTANESDSNLFYKSVNDLGIEEALAQAKGAYALTYVDVEKQKLNFIRNSERPLAIAKIRWNHFGKTVMWASEAAFLSLILSRSGYKDHEVEIFELPVNQLWSLPIPIAGNIDFEVQENVFSDLRAVKSYVRGSYLGGSAWYDNTFLDGKSGTTHKRSQSLVALPSGPSPIGKETYVWRDGVMVAKADPSKQVFLPPSSQSDEREGAETNAASVGPTRPEGADHEQRREASSEVQDRDRGNDTVVSLEFRRELRKALSRDQQEFEDDLSDVYASRSLVGEEEDPAESVDVLAIANYGGGETDDLVETLSGHYIPYKEAERVLNHGCEYCGNGVTFRDAVAWVGRKEFLCEDCCSDTNALVEMKNHFPNSKIVEAWLDGKLRGVPKPPEDWFNVDGTFDGTRSLH